MPSVKGWTELGSVHTTALHGQRGAFQAGRHWHLGGDVGSSGARTERCMRFLGHPLRNRRCCGDHARAVVARPESHGGTVAGLYAHVGSPPGSIRLLDGFISPMRGEGQLGEHAADYIILYQDGTQAQDPDPAPVSARRLSAPLGRELLRGGRTPQAPSPAGSPRATRQRLGKYPDTRRRSRWRTVGQLALGLAESPSRESHRRRFASSRSRASWSCLPSRLAELLISLCDGGRGARRV